MPNYAWGAELSDDYNERTRITAWRQAFGFLGNVSVLAVPVIAGEMTGYGSLPKEGLTIIGSMALVPSRIQKRAFGYPRCMLGLVGKEVLILPILCNVGKCGFGITLFGLPEPASITCLNDVQTWRSIH